MDKFWKFILTVLCILYVISPIDLCPGPIDDILVIILTEAAKKRKSPILGQQGQ